jgi:hypothetical protein
VTPSIGTKKISKKFEKTLDKLKKMCYNKYVIKREKNKNFSKKTLKKVKKTLDKSKKVWYNKYVIKGTKTL